MLDVLVLSYTDNANTGWRTVQCLRKLGLNVLGLKGDIHPFMYPEQMIFSPEINKAVSQMKKDSCHVEVPELHDLMDQAKVLHFVGSIGMMSKTSNKPCIVQHGGSIYRQNPQRFNAYWPDVYNTVMQCPDLMGHGAKSEVWIPYAVDTNFIKPTYSNDGKLKFGHFPSNHGVKGSKDIYAVFDMIASQLPEKLQNIFEFYCATPDEKMIWQAHLQRLSEMDVYVEALSPLQNGKPYGAWGNAALEAAAMGKIVITHNSYQDLYQREFGNSPLRIANTKKELFDHITELIKTPLSEIQAEMRSFREWVVQKHSIEATAARWWKLVYKDLFPETSGMDTLLSHKSTKRNICAVLREIHESGDESVKIKAEEALTMAKKMNQKLFDYRAEWDKELQA